MGLPYPPTPSRFNVKCRWQMGIYWPWLGLVRGSRGRPPSAGGATMTLTWMAWMAWSSEAPHCRTADQGCKEMD
eukprot:7608613-Pyramimonas_sp.AAC.1